MITAEENALLTQTSKGTPMGELLRRYWHPIAGVSELEREPVKAVRLLGEDLVLYRDLRGRYGLIERLCAHRGADMSYGFIDEEGLRCSYHGWCYDEAGRCTSQPFEDISKGSSNQRFRSQIKMVAYPVAELAGLIFAYLGPQPAPLVPNWELFTYENGFAQAIFSDIDCNWLQCAENNIDPVHTEWLHRNWSLVQLGNHRRAPTHLKIEIDEWEYGFGYRRILEGQSEDDPYWREGRLGLLPNIFCPGGTHFEYRVPIDDAHTLSVVWAWERVPVESEPFQQKEIPCWRAPVRDPDTGRWITTHTINQDIVGWVGQGPISNRTREHLGRSDAGVVMFRNQLKRDMEAVANGLDPKGLVRDPEKNNPVRWPDDRRERLTRGYRRSKLAERLEARRKAGPIGNDYFQFLAGQPEHVRRAYEEAMGI